MPRSAYQQSLTVAQDLQKLRKKKTRSEKREGYNISGMDEVSTGPVDDLFKFIGSEPNKAVRNIRMISIEVSLLLFS